MTKLRSRLLTTVVLAAIAVSAIGVGTAAAKGRPIHAPAPQVEKHRPQTGTYSGEPDAGGGPTPQRPTPATVNPNDATNLAVTVDALMLQLWALWWGWRT